MSSKLDSGQVLQHAFDETTNRLKVDASITASIANVMVVIDAAGGDNISIASADGSKHLNIDASGAAKTTLTNIESLNGELAIKIDDYTTANVTYIAKAAVGANGASAIWQIKKIDETIGLEITWADGNSNYDNVWNNRVSLTYS